MFDICGGFGGYGGVEKVDVRRGGCHRPITATPVSGNRLIKKCVGILAMASLCD